MQRVRRAAADARFSLQPAWRILVVLGSVLVLAGGMLLVSAVSPSSRHETITIPEGASKYYAYDVRILGPGRLFGSFVDDSGRGIAVAVFDEAQYAWFAFIGAGTPLFAVRDVQGTFDVSLPASGTYYLVLAHPTWDDSGPQPVRVRLVIEGMLAGFAEAGGAFLVPGVVVATAGTWLRPRASRRDRIAVA